jgi:hypothetical protein
MLEASIRRNAKMTAKLGGSFDFCSLDFPLFLIIQ